LIVLIEAGGIVNKNPYYPWVNHGNEIWQLLERHGDPDGDICLRGWYFCDETEGFNGPFSSRKKAEAALTAYADRL